jgi:hypothetical protein
MSCVVYLKHQLQLPLDDVLAVIHEFIEASLTRSARAFLRRRLTIYAPFKP